MNLETIKQRIRALREMTNARGCTEAESMRAAEKVAELMAKYDLTAGDVDFEEGKAKVRTAGESIRDHVWRSIAQNTNTTLTFIPGWGGNEISFVGRPGYVEVALYLKEVCDRAVNRAIAAEKKGRTYRRFRRNASKRKYVHAFTSAMVLRLMKRLDDLFADQRNQRERGQAVVHRDQLYSDLVPTKCASASFADARAVMAGNQAGGNVTLSHAAGGSADQPLALEGVE